MMDVSGAEALMRYLEYSTLLHATSGQVRGRTGLYELAVFPYTFVPVKGGWAFIAGYTDPNVGALCRVMGRPELQKDPRFNTTIQRTTLENEIALRDEIAAWSVRFTADRSTSATAPEGWLSSTARALSDRARDLVDAKRYSSVTCHLSGSFHVQ